jgi:hypothetical protein
MELGAPNVAMLCPECGTAAGRIFCGKCGASLRPVIPLAQPPTPDASVPEKSLARQVAVPLLKGLGYLAAAAAFFCPLGTFSEIFFFAIAVIVGLICYVILTHLDETHVDEHGGAGYWPAKPVDWNNPPEKHDSAK